MTKMTVKPKRQRRPAEREVAPAPDFIPDRKKAVWGGAAVLSLVGMSVFAGWLSKQPVQTATIEPSETDHNQTVAEETEKKDNNGIAYRLSELFPHNQDQDGNPVNEANDRKIIVEKVEKPQAQEKVKQEAPAPATVTTPTTDANRIVRIGGKKITFTPEVDAALVTMERKTGFPAEAFMEICARESDCNPANINPSSQACGLAQFMVTERTPKLFEVLHKFGAEMGYAEEAELVEDYVIRRRKDGKAILGHRPLKKDKTARGKILDLCLNPTFNAVMFGASMREHVRAYEEWVKRKTGEERNITAGEAAIMNQFGRGGLMTFAGRAWDDKAQGVDTFLHTLFSKSVVAKNRSVFFDAAGRPKTARRSYNEIINRFGGWGEIEIAAPNNN